MPVRLTVEPQLLQSAAAVQQPIDASIGNYDPAVLEATEHSHAKDQQRENMPSVNQEHQNGEVSESNANPIMSISENYVQSDAQSENVICHNSDKHFAARRVLACPWITDHGVCKAKKETSHMVLWYDDGFRILHCTTCKKMSRATHWSCPHAAQWHKCPICRDDPEEHRTTRQLSRLKPAGETVQGLLPSNRPGPEVKRQKVSRAAALLVHRKRIIQSANFNQFKIDMAKCPRLAAKFPHLYSQPFSNCGDGPSSSGHVQQPTEAPSESSHVQISSTATGAACVNAGGSGPVRTMIEMGDALSIRASTGVPE